MLTAILSTLLIVYSFMELSGLFRSQPAGFLETIHAYPFLIVSSLLSIALIIQAVPRRASLGRNSFARAVTVAGLAMIPAGLWISSLFHFQAAVIRMEQQDFLALPGEYEESSIIKGPRANPVAIGMYIKHITFRKTFLGKEPIPEVGVRYISPSQKALKDGLISPIWPLLCDWTMVRITGAGYSVAYAINDQTRREVDRTYVPLKLYPPGAEDFFSPKDLGYYWHIRYFPDYVDNNGKSESRSLEPRNPMFGVRVVRNKDILFDGLMRLQNTLQIEGILFNIKDVRPCVRITFIRDPGMPVLLLGLLLTGTGFLWQLRLKAKTSDTP